MIIFSTAAFWHDAPVDPLAEVEQVLERPAFVAGADDLLGRAAAEPLDGGQAEDDLAVLRRRSRLAAVDVRRQHVDAELAGVGDVIDQHVALVAVVDLADESSAAMNSAV